MAGNRSRQETVYVISVAAELAGMHPQTLRIYERRGLVNPGRTSGGNRRYTDADIARLRRIAQLAAERKIPCFCADLTVNPVLVDWNKNVAARLAPLPDMTIGVLETNGHQNYKNWDAMRQYHPCHDAGWTTATRGVFNLDADFYARSGGILLPSPHYAALV